jgi:Protein of unknown function DUF2625
MSAARSADELSNVPNPAWPGIQRAIQEAPVSVHVLQVPQPQGLRVLHRLQVTTASAVGALAVNCGGLLVDHGWLRVLGGGSGDLPDLARASRLGDPATADAPPPWLVVAYDVLGGVFAVDGGGLGIAPGQVCYRGPDTLRWVELGAGHAGFLAAALAGGLNDFYAELRWPGWEQEVDGLGAGEGVAVYPPPFTEQGRDIAAASRRPVPLAELLGFYDEVAAQLADTPDGTVFSFRTA